VNSPGRVPVVARRRDRESNPAIPELLIRPAAARPSKSGAPPQPDRLDPAIRRTDDQSKF
jgi:hypothetical protein